MSAPDLYSEAFGRDPYPFYRVFRDEYPVVQDPVSGRYLVSRHADVGEVLRGDAFSTRAYDHVVEPVYGKTLMQLDGKEHSRSRRYITPLLHPPGLRELFEPAIERVVARLLDRFRDGGRVEFVDAFTAWFGVGIVADVLGVSAADEPDILRWYTAILDYQFNLQGDPDVHAAGLAAAAEARAFVRELVRHRRRQPGDDLISRMAAVEVDGQRMAEEDITSFCVLLLVAGSETTDKATASLVKNLIEHPEALAAVRADRSLIDRALAETLRYTPPLHLIVRTAARDVELSGVTIPGGAEVLAMVGSANRDERVFDDPDRFDLMREDAKIAQAFTAAADHAAFGWGRHFCAGARVAQVEIRHAVNALLDAFAEIRFADGEEPREIGLWARAPRRLVLELVPA